MSRLIKMIQKHQDVDNYHNKIPLKIISVT